MRANGQPPLSPARYSQTNAHALLEEWERLCERFLPIAPRNSSWRFSRPLSPIDPEQGWKLHVSATILSAVQVLKRVGLFLHRQDILFKAPRSLEELNRLNAGVYFGLSQIGKCITVYPQNPEQALLLARKLHQLTYRLPAPEIPFDFRFSQSSSVFYRYGGFSELEIENGDGTKTLAIRDEKGALIPDQRSPETETPNWVVNPFLLDRRRRKPQTSTSSPLQTTIRAFETLSQRGKGGVYRAVDVSARPVRLCILKEGRRHGETSWDGRDGSWRVRHEARVLKRLLKAGIPVPEVYLSFTVDSHFYLATEFIEGGSLQSLLDRRGKKLRISKALLYAIQACDLLHAIHSAGWVWRDCKPLNFILAKNDQLRPIDFEGACPIHKPDPASWGTTGYVAPEFQDEVLPDTRAPEDLFALGVTLYQLFGGDISTITTRISGPIIKNLREQVPATVKKVVASLLNKDPLRRPDALTVSERLQTLR